METTLSEFVNTANSVQDLPEADQLMLCRELDQSARVPAPLLTCDELLSWIAAQ